MPAHETNPKEVQLHEQWHVENLGEFDVQLSLGELVVTDRRGGIPKGSGPNIHLPLSQFPADTWVRLQDKQGGPVPLVARWDGVRMTVRRQDGADSMPTVEDRLHRKSRFVLRAGNVHSHPDGGFSVQLSTSGGGEVRLLHDATEGFSTWSLNQLPQGRGVVPQSSTGGPLPVKLTRTGEDVMVEWLPMQELEQREADGGSISTAVSAASTPDGDNGGSLWKLAAVAAAGVAAAWLRNRGAGKVGTVTEGPVGTLPAATQAVGRSGTTTLSATNLAEQYRCARAAESDGDVPTAQALYTAVGATFPTVERDPSRATAALGASLFRLGVFAEREGRTEEAAGNFRKAATVFDAVAVNAAHDGKADLAERARKEAQVARSQAGKVQRRATATVRGRAPAPSEDRHTAEVLAQQRAMMRQMDQERMRTNQMWAQNLGRI
ncbi:tol-pal system YbgF family protein [Geodermatophilus sp. SYSU D00779]